MIIKIALVLLSIVSMFSIGLQFSKRKEENAFRTFVGLAILLNLFLVPSVAYFLVWSMKIQDSYKIAILLCSLSPGGTSAALFVLRSHADPFIGGILILVLNTIGSIFVPILVYLFMDLNSIDSYLIIFKLLIIGTGIQALPLLLGALAQRKRNLDSVFWSKKFNLMANFLLLFCISWLSVENYSSLKDISWKEIMAILLLSLLASNSGLLFYKLSKGIQSAISAVTGIRNLTLALILVEFIWNDPKVSLAIMLYGGIMFLVAYASSMFWRKNSFNKSHL